LVGFIVLIALTIGIILHELHGITWAKYTKDGFKSIRFGVLWKFLTPYCHCKEPLVKHYIIGGLCQLLSWGFSCFIILYHWQCILLILEYFSQWPFGDFMIIFISKENKNSLVLDHPSEVGCYIYREHEVQIS
jgi:hypothetical protein